MTAKWGAGTEEKGHMDNPVVTIGEREYKRTK